MNKHTFSSIREIGTCIFFVVALFLTSKVSAQYLSKREKFKVDQVRGCAPFTVTIIDPDVSRTAVGQINVVYEKLPNGERNPSNPSCFNDCFQYTYNNSGSYYIKVLYSNIGFDSIKITVDPNLSPNFEVYSCKGSKVSVKITDKTYDQYLVDFDNNGTVDNTVLSGNTAPFSYATAGDYTIGVIGQFKNSAPNCQKKEKLFEAIESLPTLQLKALKAIDKNSLKIDFVPNANPNIQYKLDIANNAASNFQQLRLLYNTNTETTNVVDLDKNFYCLQIGAYDACDRSVWEYSPIMCTQKVKLKVDNGVNTVSWESDLKNVQSILIHRTGGGNSEIIKEINPDSFSSDDRFPEIMCNTDYSYYLVFNYPSGATSTSLIKSGKSFLTLTPNAIANVSTVTNGQSVTLTWVEDPLQDPFLSPNTYSVFKSINKSAYPSAPEATLAPSKPPSLTYQDNAYSEQSNMCYKINYTDACLNKSNEGLEACPLVLQGSIDKKNNVTLSWKPYLGWQNGVKFYMLDKFSKDGALLNAEKVTSPGFVDDKQDLVNQTISYQITAIANDGSLIPSTSNTIKVVKAPNLFYPTAFTPNGDGINDTFIVLGQFVEKMDLKIYDRWGGLVFSTEKNEPWNGYLNGKLLNEGSYIWKADITDFSSQTFSRTGTIFLITKEK